LGCFIFFGGGEGLAEVEEIDLYACLNNRFLQGFLSGAEKSQFRHWVFVLTAALPADLGLL